MKTPVANNEQVTSAIAVAMVREVFDDLSIHIYHGMAMRMAMVNDHEVFDAAANLRDMLDFATAEQEASE